MVTHNIPCRGAAAQTAPAWVAWTPAARARVAPEQAAGVNQGRHGPLRVPLHLAARRQGAGVDPGALSRGARARRLRGPLLLSGARPARARCRRQRPAQGDRNADRPFSALLGGARAIRGGALRPQRSPEDRRRGANDAHRAAQEPCRHQGRDRLCRPRPQVSDLGARTLPRGTRGGHREGPRAQEAAGLPGNGGRSARSTGMMASRGSKPAVAGGLARHIPVLGRRAVEFLAVRPGGVYVDATFGAGGYSREILAAADCRVIGIDRDRSAIAAAADLVQAAAGRLVLVEDRFSRLAAAAQRAGEPLVDGVVFDLGVSSMQLDEAERGFSFRHDGPLDMRMGGEGPTAAEVVAAASERDLASIIATLGEERRARAIARALVAARRDAPPRTTRALAELVAGVVHARPGTIHPATRTFQALRIFVNEELAELASGLAAAEAVLKPGGRLVVVAFHSLEDRIAKSFLAERSRRGSSSRHVPQAPQAAANPRARSAKLRAAERTAAPPAVGADAALLPRLPALADVLARQSAGRRR